MSERISYWPVRHGGTEQGRNHTKVSLVVFGSGQAGWVDELTILHETNQTYFKPSNKQICIGGGSHRFVTANPELALTAGKTKHLHPLKVCKAHLCNA